jgi:hypothetical protein
LLTLQDRNPHSPTYGCFDRAFWHDKVVDFSNGCAVEAVWPLALAATLEVPGNRFLRHSAVLEWGRAGIAYAARSAHADGACDEYLPMEKSPGAAAISLLAMVESARLLDLRGVADELLGKRAQWLAEQHVARRFSHHEALVALGLERVGQWLGTDRWKAAGAKRLADLLEEQDSEGWFPEDERCDPGCHAQTVGFLAQLQQAAPSPAIASALEKAVRFAESFVHPDGTFGGEYGGWDAFALVPYGFELAGATIPQALAVSARLLEAAEQGTAPAGWDDRLAARIAWGSLLAWRHFQAERPALSPRPAGRVYFRNAGMIIERRDGAELYLSIRKGGGFRFFRDGELVCADTQLSARFAESGGGGVAAAHLPGDYDVEFSQDSIRVAGAFGWVHQPVASTGKMMMLRPLMQTVGRIDAELVGWLRHKLATGRKKPAPLNFARHLHWSEGRLHVSDEIQTADWSKVESIELGVAQSWSGSPASAIYQAGQLLPRLDLTPKLRLLSGGAPLLVTRTF